LKARAFSTADRYLQEEDLGKRPIVRQEETAAIEMAGRSLPYVVKRSSARRTLSLRVHETGQVLVHAPLRLPQGHIEGFVLRHAAWVLNQLARRPQSPAWRDGMDLPYLGTTLRLVLAEPDPGRAARPSVDEPLRPEEKLLGAAARDPGVRLDGDRLLCPVTHGAVEERVRAWYRCRAQPILDRRLAATCRAVGRAEPAWRLSDARTRWGSLSAKGVVGLNWRLIKASAPEIDYVICHELAHFRHRNHSAAFWREVARLCPDYATARAGLRAKNGLYFQF
jgi:predicted metal-dependent hydrolase